MDEFGEAIGNDLLRMGARMHQVGTEQFSWWDLRVYVESCPPESFLFRAINGPFWSWEVRLLGRVIDTLEGANWQRSGGKGKRPKSRWPWSNRDDEHTYGKAAPLTDVRDFLIYRNGRAPHLAD